MTPDEVRAELLDSIAIDVVRRAIDEIDEFMDRHPSCFRHEEGELSRFAMNNLAELKSALEARAFTLGSAMAARITAEDLELAA